MNVVLKVEKVWHTIIQYHWW